MISVLRNSLSSTLTPCKFLLTTFPIPETIKTLFCVLQLLINVKKIRVAQTFSATFNLFPTEPEPTSEKMLLFNVFTTTINHHEISQKFNILGVLTHYCWHCIDLVAVTQHWGRKQWVVTDVLPTIPHKRFIYACNVRERNTKERTAKQRATYVQLVDYIDYSRVHLHDTRSNGRSTWIRLIPFK